MLSFEQIWNKLEIRVLVISSLGLQIFLLAISGFRKHVISVRWAENTGFKFRGPLALIFHLLLWLAYLLADYVATVALAYVRGSEISKATPEKKTKYLLVFWAPFFILHLGGQDTITALSVEDNELWARHMLIFLSQVGLAMYNYFSSNLRVGELWPPAALMFAVAIFKYGERVWSLQRASMSSLRSSMITKPDAGPNYAKFMQEYTSSNDAGLVAVIKVENEKHKDKGDLVGQEKEEEELDLKYSEVVCKAYEFFKTFKRLFVDLILSYKDRDESQKYFAKLKHDDAYKLIEIELSWMYEILHSKGSVIYSYKHYGWISRVVTLIIIIIALCFFVRSDHNEYGRFETILTYVLLAGAVSLEIIAICFMLLSFWTYASMKDCWLFSPFKEFLFSIMEKMRPVKKPRWSNRMAQYSLITYSLEDRPRWWKSIMNSLGLKKSWDEYRYTTCVPVNDYLKELVFQELKKKMNNIDDPASYRRFTDHRGQWALQRKGYYQEFGWSVEAEFDESILLWHIATDLLFHETLDEQKQKKKQKQKPEPKLAKLPEQKTGSQPDSQSEPQSEHNITGDNNPVNNPVINPEQQRDQEQEKKWNREISQDISNYVLFLLIVRPFMMPAGIGQIRFGDTCAEAANFLQSLGEIDKRNLKNNAGKENTDKGNNNKNDVEHGNLKNIVRKENTEKGNYNEDDVEHGTVGMENTEKGNKEMGNSETGNTEKGYTGKGGTETGNTDNGITEMGNIKKGNDDKKRNAVRRLLEVNTEYDPQLIKGDRSKSVLFKGCRLAHQLKKEFTPEGESKPDWDKMWRLISVVWVEILCYAASKCSGQFHAKQLSKGGELLTVIWFLMAHLGMGEQYRIEEGHARAKLIVSK